MPTTKDLLEEILKMPELDAEERAFGERLLAQHCLMDEDKQYLKKTLEAVELQISEHLDAVSDLIYKFQVTALLTDLTFVGSIGSIGDVDQVVRGGRPDMIKKMAERFTT